MDRLIGLAPFFMLASCICWLANTLIWAWMAIENPTACNVLIAAVFGLAFLATLLALALEFPLD